MILSELEKGTGSRHGKSKLDFKNRILIVVTGFQEPDFQNLISLTGFSVQYFECLLFERGKAEK